jgi:hypothetical protein
VQHPQQVFASVAGPTPAAAPQLQDEAVHSRSSQVARVGQLASSSVCSMPCRWFQRPAAVQCLFIMESHALRFCHVLVLLLGCLV